jgi:hypothetical protein
VSFTFFDADAPILTVFLKPLPGKSPEDAENAPLGEIPQHPGRLALFPPLTLG